MKNLNILKLFTLFFAIILIQVFSTTGVQAANCSELGSGEVPSEVEEERQCATSPTSLVFKIYELRNRIDIIYYCNILKVLLYHLLSLKKENLTR